jgi:hypothetical protein
MVSFSATGVVHWSTLLALPAPAIGESLTGECSQVGEGVQSSCERPITAG